eukprot:6471755-Amphidinium_carterae.2
MIHDMLLGDSQTLVLLTVLPDEFVDSGVGDGEGDKELVWKTIEKFREHEVDIDVDGANMQHARHREDLVDVISQDVESKAVDKVVLIKVNLVLEEQLSLHLENRPE